MADDSWVEKYKLEHESSETWIKKKKFLISYHDKFEEDRLLCLAQTYVNVMEMGCRYPQRLMTEVSELATGIGEELVYRGKPIDFVKSDE